MTLNIDVMAVEAARTSSLTTQLVHIHLKKPILYCIVFGCYIDPDVHQLISASVPTPTPHSILKTTELKSQILKKIYTKTVRFLNIKYLRCYFTKLLRCYQREIKSSWWKQDVSLKNVTVFRFMKILHCWHLVFSVFHFKVQMVSAMAGIGVALGDVVLHRGQGK